MNEKKGTKFGRPNKISSCNTGLTSKFRFNELLLDTYFMLGAA